MIQYRTVQQSYYDSKAKQRRQRSVQVATRIQFDEKAKAFKKPKNIWHAMWDRLWGKG